MGDGRMGKPIATDAWENGRWKVEHSEMPAAAPGTLPLDFSRRYPVRCLWCGRELQSNVIVRRKVTPVRAGNKLLRIPLPLPLDLPESGMLRERRSPRSWH